MSAEDLQKNRRSYQAKKKKRAAIP